MKQLFFVLDSPIAAFAAATYSAISVAKLFRPTLPPPWEYTLVAMIPALLTIPFLIFSWLAISGVMFFVSITVAFLLSVPLLAIFSLVRRGSPLKKWQLGSSAVAALVVLLHFVPVQNYYLSRLDAGSRDRIAISWFGEPYAQAKKAILGCSDLEEKIGKISSLVASGRGPFPNQTRRGRDGSYFFDYVSTKGKGEIIVGIHPATVGWRMSLARVDLNQDESIYAECE